MFSYVLNKEGGVCHFRTTYVQKLVLKKKEKKKTKYENSV